MPTSTPFLMSCSPGSAPCQLPPVNENCPPDANQVGTSSQRPGVDEDLPVDLGLGALDEDKVTRTSSRVSWINSRGSGQAKLPSDRPNSTTASQTAGDISVSELPSFSPKESCSFSTRRSFSALW